MPVVLAPAATFAVYAIQAHIRGSKSLDTVKAFTSLALIALVSHPASRFLCAVPNVASSLGCFQRIQDFLLIHSPICEEKVRPNNLVPSSPRSENGRLMDRSGSASLNSSLPEVGAVIMEQAVISPSRDTPIVLRGVNLYIPKGAIVMLTGPVASGKSVLLRSILGETTCHEGSIFVTPGPIGYCSQTPWIIHGNIKDIICGKQYPVDEEWYRDVVEACDLRSDLLSLSDGDRTVIASRGSNLSGGQKHRLALARALYNRPGIFVLDDVLSALDKSTEDLVFDRLFGKTGLFRKMGSTVVLATQNSQSNPNYQ
jgi:ATP-binding cassette subfamily C (CFTR/MRP) protein 1